MMCINRASSRPRVQDALEFWIAAGAVPPTVASDELNRIFL